MTDFDIMGSNLSGAQGGAPSSGFDIIGPNAGGRPLYGQPQNGAGQPGLQTVNGVAYNTGSAPQNGAGQPVPQQQGAPVSGLLAGILGLPTYSGAIPGAAYTTPQQQVQQTGGGQMQAPQISQMTQTNDGMSGLSQPQAPQISQMSPLLAGIIGAPQPNGGQQQMGSQQGGQPQNIGSSIGGLLGQMIYGAQSRDV